jgi:hypothetical protein
MHNFNDDGGAVFRRDAEFVYGHLCPALDRMKATCCDVVSLLSLALIDRCSAKRAVTWSFLDARDYNLIKEANAFLS